MAADLRPRLPARHDAGLFLGGLLFVYWAVAAELLVVGERASALGRLTGRFRLRAVPVAVAVELAVALLAALEGAPGSGCSPEGCSSWASGSPARSRGPTASSTAAAPVWSGNDAPVADRDGAAPGDPPGGGSGGGF